MSPRILPRRRWLRRLLVWGTAIAAVLVGVTVTVGAWLYSRAEISTVGTLDFANPLQIPPVLEPDTDAQGPRCSASDSSRA